MKRPPLHKPLITKTMKKKQIKKLSLHKTRISALEQGMLNGGIDLSNPCATLQETICFTACRGEQDCQLYRTDNICGGTLEC